jgi:hypothetical protein
MKCRLLKSIKIHINSNTWFVIRGTTRKSTSTGSTIPSFERVRMVTINKRSWMKCSCGYTDCFGIPDCHIAHVALKYGVNFKSFGHNDVDLRYHNKYCRLVTMKAVEDMNETELEI